MKMMPPGRYYELNGVPWPDDPECGSKKDRMKKMLEPNEQGDEFVLSLASNLMEVYIVYYHLYYSPIIDHSASKAVTRGVTNKIKYFTEIIRIRPVLECEVS